MLVLNIMTVMMSTNDRPSGCITTILKYDEIYRLKVHILVQLADVVPGFQIVHRSV